VTYFIIVVASGNSGAYMLNVIRPMIDPPGSNCATQRYQLPFISGADALTTMSFRVSFGNARMSVHAELPAMQLSRDHVRHPLIDAVHVYTIINPCDDYLARLQ
jgi:hypothetical protein